VSEGLLFTKIESKINGNHRVYGWEDDEEQKTKVTTGSVLKAGLRRSVQGHWQESIGEYDGR